MSSIATAAVGVNARPLAPAPIAGTSADVVTVINLDTANTVMLGSSATFLPLGLGPLASVTVQAPVWAVAATETLEVGVLPGGGSYSPGSLTITGPVTAEITGPVEVEGSIEISGTPTVELAAGTTVDVSGTTDVNVQNANIDVIGAGGFISPGQVGNLFNSVNTVIGPSTFTQIANFLDVSTFASVVVSANDIPNSSVAAGAAVCAIIIVQWLDSASNVVAVDTLSTLLSPGTWNATWELPVKGAAMALNVQNVGTVGNITVGANSIFVDGAYRVVPNARALLCEGGTAPTLTGCTVQLQSRPVYAIIGWVAAIVFNWTSAITNVVFPLPQWVGEVAGFYQITGTALARNATIVDLTYAVQGGVVSGSGYANGIILNIPGSIDANPVPFSLDLPPTQCAVIIDTPASAGAFTMSLIGVGN